MSEIFKYIDDDNNEHLLVSKDYVDIHLRNLENTIKDIADKANVPINDSVFKILDSTEEVTLNNNSNTGIPANLIKQDSKHKLLTDNDISIFKSKPSTHEVNTLIKKSSNNIKNEVTSLFNDLFNTSDMSLQRLKRLTELIKNDDTLNSLFKVLDDTISIDEFNKHIADASHLNNNDRNALNILLDLINNGVFDKLNKYINDIDSLLNDIKQYVSDNITLDRFADDIILGSDISCTHRLSLDQSNDHVLLDLPKGNIAIKSGTYMFYKLDLVWPNDKYRVLHGAGSENTILKFKILSQARYISIRDIGISGPTISCDDVKFDNVTFTGCTIDIGSSVRFNNCKFVSCNFKFDLSSMDNMIFGCNFVNTEIPKTIRPNTIIENNY